MKVSLQAFIGWPRWPSRLCSFYQMATRCQHFYTYVVDGLQQLQIQSVRCPAQLGATRALIGLLQWAYRLRSSRPPSRSMSKFHPALILNYKLQIKSRMCICYYVRIYLMRIVISMFMTGPIILIIIKQQYLVLGLVVVLSGLVQGYLAQQPQRQYIVCLLCNVIILTAVIALLTQPY